MSQQKKRLTKLLQQMDTRSVSLSSRNSGKNNMMKKTSYNKYNVESASSLGTLKNKTIFITGASRGIGLAIALKCASDGCNIAIASKTATLHPKLPGTIYTAAKQIEDAGGKCLPIICDIRSEKQISDAVNKCVNKFGNVIDCLINNASAINLSLTQNQLIKKYDLMHNVNCRGTFITTKYCLPYLKNSDNPHVLTISPPLNMDKKWFSGHIAYALSKYAMSMCTFGWSEELRKYNISSNSLWPRTAIATSAIKNILGGNYSINRSRSPNIMADAAYLILLQDSKTFNGNFVIDEDILRCVGITDFHQYKINPNINDNDLMPDFFLSND